MIRYIIEARNFGDTEWGNLYKDQRDYGTKAYATKVMDKVSPMMRCELRVTEVNVESESEVLRKALEKVKEMCMFNQFHLIEDFVRGTLGEYGKEET